MTEADRAAHLTALGWSDFFADQLSDDERDASPMRVSGVHRSRISAIGDAGPVRLEPHGRARAADFAVGDWVLADAQTRLIHRRLDRKTLLERHVEGGRVPQLIAANVDTLFIVTSCNADFNPARLERYLALANEAGTTPVILLTKADETSDAASFEDRAAALQRGLVAVSLNAKSPDAAKVLAPWIGPGQTIVLVGSSGVGKSTLLNTLAGPDQATPQATSGVREDDAKGRHTTTSRSLHATADGGLVIDTPGIRSLHVGDAAFGIETLFAEITELAPLCKFRDCTHAHEPGCAVRAAVAAGTLPPERLARWSKLREENRVAVAARAGPHGGRGKR